MKYLVTRTWKPSEYDDLLEWFSCPLTEDVCGEVLSLAERASELLLGPFPAAEVAFYGCCGEFHDDSLPVDDIVCDALWSGNYMIVEVEGHWPDGARTDCERTEFCRGTDPSGSLRLEVYWSAFPKNCNGRYESVAVPVSVFQEALDEKTPTSSDAGCTN